MTFLFVGWVAMMASGWVLLRAVARYNREGLPIMEIVKPTSMILAAISLLGWVAISLIFGRLLWAPVLAIPITAPVAVFAGTLLVPAYKQQNSWGGVEYSYSYQSFIIAGGLVGLVAILPQLWAAATQLGLE